ncbi:MAG: hypothetical protein KUL75_03255 [Sterolibacterium sp.]|nr:hypothetical protein [Sterolibacterium sp.]
MRTFYGQPRDHDLHQLQQLARSIEIQLELLHQLDAQERREIDLAQCFPDGKLIVHGQLVDLRPTIDPEVLRGQVLQDGQQVGTLYINVRRGKCAPVDPLGTRWLQPAGADAA